MKDILGQLLRDQPPGMHRSTVREYLLARILQSLQDQGAFVHWAFCGGTALRFLFRIPRYSEDLDFALTEPSETHGLAKTVARIKSSFEAEGYTIGIKARQTGAVAGAYVEFRGLLHDLGISPYQDEVISVKVEIDTNPPRGATTTTTVIRRHVVVRVMHHDRSSLFAGKLHAVLMRSYTKGRDLFDLGWYLADPAWPAPNLELLNNALEQTGWSGESLTLDSWRDVVADRLKTLDWNAAVADVAPFLERPEDLALVDLRTLLSLLAARA